MLNLDYRFLIHSVGCKKTPSYLLRWGNFVPRVFSPSYSGVMAIRKCERDETLVTRLRMGQAFREKSSGHQSMISGKKNKRKIRNLLLCCFWS